MKVARKKSSEKTVERLVKKFPLRIVEKKSNYYLIEVCSGRHQEEEILRELKKMGIKELVRTGRIAISK